MGIARYTITNAQYAAHGWRRLSKKARKGQRSLCTSVPSADFRIVCRSDFGRAIFLDSAAATHYFPKIYGETIGKPVSYFFSIHFFSSSTLNL